MMSKSKITGPYVLTFDITYKCTMRCKHCFNASGENSLNRKELSDDKVINICKEIGEFKPNVVCFCGGEPLLRKDLICEACKTIIEKSQGVTKVNTVTNGELMTADIAKQLKKANFQLVQVSLDGAQAQTHDWLRNKTGAFERAINAIKYLVDVGLHVAVACTPTLYNIDEVDKVIQLCEELGVSDFRMQPLMNLGRAISQLKGYVPQYKDYRDLSLKLNYLRYINVGLNKMSIEWGDPIDHLIRFRTTIKENCMHMGINAYGDVTLSPYLPLTVGNVDNHSLHEYWESGLDHAWELPIVNYLAERMQSSTDLHISDPNNKIPLVYLEKGIDIDLINKDYFNVSAEEILQNFYKN